MQCVMSSDERPVFHRRSWTNVFFPALTLAISSLAMACSDPVKSTGTSGSSGGDTSSSSSTSSTGGMGGGGAGGGSSGGTGGTGGTGGSLPDVPGPVEEVLTFDRFMGELGEGIAIDEKTAYITFGSTKVITVDLETKMRADYGSVPAPIGIASPQGIAIDNAKNVYVAVSSSDPVMFKPGIYKFPAGGGTATLHAEHVNMTHPRHILIHPTGNMVVSAPPNQRIFVIQTDGTISVLGPTQALSGDQSSACAWGEGIPYGISSVTFHGTTAFGANADRALIGKGMATGPASFTLDDMPLAGPDCATLGGAESITIDPYDKGATDTDVALLVAGRRTNKITKVRATGGVTVLADGTNLYEPSAIAMAYLGTSRYLYIVNSARTTFDKGGIPGLVRMRLGNIK